METTTMSKPTKNSPESDASTSLNFKETELTLGLPGESRTTPPENGGVKICSKRGFSETVDLKLGRKDADEDDELSETSISRSGKATAASKAQVVGWPPVRSFRKNVLKSSSSSSCTYVKVAVDGAPYLRKVDLELYSGYTELLRGLTEMFTCFTIRQQLNESKLIDPVNGTEYVSTYEDKDGDWMLVGDVPWKMFVESCKRLRLMKSSEAIGLAAPGTPPKSASTR